MSCSILLIIFAEINITPSPPSNAWVDEESSIWKDENGDIWTDS